jgi:hypothetical protein
LVTLRTLTTTATITTTTITHATPMKRARRIANDANRGRPLPHL